MGYLLYIAGIFAFASTVHGHNPGSTPIQVSCASDWSTDEDFVLLSEWSSTSEEEQHQHVSWSSDTAVTTSDHSDDDILEVKWSSATDDSSCIEIQAVPGFKKTARHFIPSEVSSGSKMKSKALNYLSIKSSLKTKCSCGKQCIKPWNVQSVKKLRERFWLNSKNFRMTSLKTHYENSDKKGKYRYYHIRMDGIDYYLCSKVFLAVLRVNKNSMTSAINLHNEDCVSTYGKAPRDWSAKTLILITWLEQYFTFHGERMPHKKDVVLPYGTVVLDIYKQYERETTNPVSRSQFYKKWSENFAYVKARKTNSFTKCTTCVMLERQMAKTFNVELRAEYRKQKDEHNIRQMLERKYYYSKREAAINLPSRYLSLIIDGMDQGKTNLPHFTGRKPKNFNPADLLKTHVTGVLNHGRGGFRAYIDVCEYAHDPNLVINVLLKELLHTSKENLNRLPGTLYLQADNCWRENKNRHVLSFLELLVHENIFNEVHLSFLPVGHTHEDIDAKFSRISEKLSSTECETIEDFMNLFKHSEMLSNMEDMKQWLDPFLNGIEKHTGPLHYKFMQNEGEVKGFYKGRHNQSWKTLKENLVSSIPTGEPTTLRPDFSDIDIDRKENHLKTISYLFRRTENLSKWKQFYDQLGQTAASEISVPILQQLPKQSAPLSIGIGLIPEVRELLDKETRVPEVLVKKRKGSELASETVPSKNHKGTCRSKPAAKKTARFKENKRRTYTTVEKTILIQLNGQEKKHIWMMILLNLFINLTIALSLFFFIMRLVVEFCMLYILNEFIFAETMKMISIHIGSFLAVCSLSFLQVHHCDTRFICNT